MWLVKGLIIAAAFSVCAHYGFRLSKKYIRREAFFFEMLLFCDYLCSEINFLQTSLSNILEKYTASFKSDLSIYLSAVNKSLAENGDITEATLKEAIPILNIKAEEYALCLQFFNSLGKSDTENQLYSINGFKTAFSNFYMDAMAEKKKYSGVFWKLSLLAAAAVSILII